MLIIVWHWNQHILISIRNLFMYRFHQFGRVPVPLLHKNGLWGYPRTSLYMDRTLIWRHGRRGQLGEITENIVLDVNFHIWPSIRELLIFPLAVTISPWNFPVWKRFKSYLMSRYSYVHTIVIWRVQFPRLTSVFWRI